MPLFVLGAFIAVFVTAYIYFFNRRGEFTHKKPPPNDPFNVIYLPADLEAEKNKRKSQPKGGV